MDDMREKLFPIFLKEAKTNLAALRRYLWQDNLSRTSKESLETAFRAAHTLKGTANLVKADSIYQIARRLEAMLEKHFAAETKPTPVEQEAMQLSVDWLEPLIAALKGEVEEPKLFVTEALQAFDLAEAFPGRTPLAELLDSRAEQRTPQLDDPFASDPAIPVEEEQILREARDPFADDPGFGLAENGAAAEPGEGNDPFAEDIDFSATELPGRRDEHALPTALPADKIPEDPFAEDPLVLDDEPVDSDQEQDAGLQDDPFAEDEHFDPAVEEPPSSQQYEPTTASVAERAEKIAESLLLPQEEDAPRKDYVSCVFTIGARDYSLPIRQMKEIADLPRVLPLPLAPPMVSGLINLRGQVIPLINLSILNQHQQKEVRLQRRVVIAEYQHETLAFLVDGVPQLSEEFIGEKVDMPSFLARHKVKGT